MNKISEHNIIELMKKKSKATPSNIVKGIGDDCAVIDVGEGLLQLISTDSLVQGIHFSTLFSSPGEIAQKSIAVNISDITAMGGIPKYILLSISIPKTIDLKWMSEFSEAFCSAANKSGVNVIGGDTTGSTDSIFINITVVGYSDNKTIKYRDAAKDGDHIFVTGNLGDSLAGLKSLQMNLNYSVLKKIHQNPRAHAEEGVWLARQPNVHAMMDVSDGLYQDIQKICLASNVGYHIELEDLPVSKDLMKFCREQNFKPHELALAGGEDYCLLFTASSNSRKIIEESFQDEFGSPVFRVGEIVAKDSLGILKNNKPFVLSNVGFDHFKDQT